MVTIVPRREKAGNPLGSHGQRQRTGHSGTGEAAEARPGISGALLGPRCGAAEEPIPGLSSAHYALTSMSRMPDPGRVGSRRFAAHIEHGSGAEAEWSAVAGFRISALS